MSTSAASIAAVIGASCAACGQSVSLFIKHCVQPRQKCGMSRGRKNSVMSSGTVSFSASMRPMCQVLPLWFCPLIMTTFICASPLFLMKIIVPRACKKKKMRSLLFPVMEKTANLFLLCAAKYSWYVY